MPADSPPKSGLAPQLPAHLTLRNGQHVVLRRIRDDDTDGVLESFALLSEGSRYTRFMAFMKDLPDRLLYDVVHPVPGKECTLVAVAGDSETGHLVGGSRYVAIPGRPKTCEFAITVIDSWQSTGLGRILLQTLVDFARLSDFDAIEGYVLSSNVGMRRLAHRLGFADTVCPDDPTQHIVRLDLKRPDDKTSA